MDPTKKPETNKFLALEIAFEQLALWLGGTKEEVKILFNLNEIKDTFKTRTPTHIVIDSILHESSDGGGTRCEILDQKDWVMCAKLIGNISGKLRIANDRPRL